MSKKIVMLVGPGPSSKAMYNGLKDQFEIHKILMPGGKPGGRKRFLQRRVKRLGLFTVIGQVLFKVLVVPVLKRTSKNRTAEIIAEKGLSYQDFPEHLVKKLPHFNTARFRKYLQKLDPDIVIVNGTEIIPKRILECIDGTFVNTHVGITPKYRGVHGGYWALASGDPENCGVTVHLVDPGIDTGGILYQGTIQATSKDTFITYPYLQIAVGIDLMKKALSDVASGTVQTQKGPDESKLWYHPTLWTYLVNRVAKGVR